MKTVHLAQLTYDNEFSFFFPANLQLANVKASDYERFLNNCNDAMEEALIKHWQERKVFLESCAGVCVTLICLILVMAIGVEYAVALHQLWAIAAILFFSGMLCFGVLQGILVAIYMWHIIYTDNQNNVCEQLRDVVSRHKEWLTKSKLYAGVEFSQQGPQITFYALPVNWTVDNMGGRDGADVTNGGNDKNGRVTEQIGDGNELNK